MDLSQFTDDELKAELGGMRLALKATLGRPYDGREEYKNADLRSKIEAFEVRTGQAPQCQPDLKARNVRRRDRQRRVVHIRKILIRGLCRNCAPTFFFFEWHLGPVSQSLLGFSFMRSPMAQRRPPSATGSSIR